MSAEDKAMVEALRQKILHILENTPDGAKKAAMIISEMIKRTDTKSPP